MFNAAGKKPVGENFRRFCLCTLHLACFGVLIGFVLIANFYPTSDDWIYVLASNIHTAGDFVDWLFQRHNEHLIPLQKAVHYLLCRHSGYDFRYLVLLNVFVAAGASLFMTGALRIYRGRTSLGDMLAPLILLSAGLGFIRWDFQLQFLSSIFFVAGSSYFFLRYLAQEKNMFLALALFCAALCALCGANGLIFSFCYTGMYILYLGHDLLRGKKRPPLMLVLTAALVGAANLLLLLTTPSTMSFARGIEPGVFLRFVYDLMSSGTAFFAVAAYPFTSLVIPLLLAGAGLVVILRLYKKTLTRQDVFMALSLGAGLLCLLSIALGRYAYHAGHPHPADLIMHYAQLFTLLPVLAWGIVSSRGARERMLVAAILIPFCAASHLVNFQGMKHTARGLRSINLAMAADFNTRQDIREIVDKYYDRFYYVDTEDGRRLVLAGLEILRANQYPLYRLRKQ